MNKKHDSRSRTRPQLHVQLHGETDLSRGLVSSDEFLLLKGFRALEPNVKSMVLATVSAQAADCLARKRPTLKLVSAEGKPRS